MKVEKSISMHSHLLKIPCKCQIVTDTKSCNASQFLFRCPSYSIPYSQCCIALNRTKVLVKGSILCLIIYEVTIVEMRSNKWLTNCKERWSWDIWWSFCNKTIVFLTLLNILLRCSWKSSLVSKNIPKCFWVSGWVTMLYVKINEGWGDFWILQEKRTSWDCLLGSGLKLIFH